MTKLYALLFTAGCLVFIFCKNNPGKTAKKYTYRGKFNVEFYLNNVLGGQIGSFLIYDQYLFERDESFHWADSSEINRNGDIIDTKRTAEYFTLDGFMLTDLKTDTCFKFAPDSIKPVLKSIIPITHKKTGIQIRANIDELKPYLNSVTFLKDTLIGHDKFKLLISDQSNNPDSKIIKKIIFYSNVSLKDFPFHPMSKTLDEKFGGVIFKYSYVTFKGEVEDIVYHYTDGLDEIETKKIQGFIKAAGLN